jgi:hypothetical protein
MEPVRPAIRLLVWMTMPWQAELSPRAATARWPERLRLTSLRRFVLAEAVDAERLANSPNEPVLDGRGGGSAHSAGSHLRALVSCGAVSEELPLVVDGSRRPSAAMAEHLRSCLSCQAELASYRRLLRALRSMRDQPVTSPPPDLVGETLRAVHACLAGRSKRAADTWVVAGAVAALGMAALGAGALVFRAALVRGVLVRASGLSRAAGPSRVISTAAL